MTNKKKENKKMPSCNFYYYAEKEMSYSEYLYYNAEVWNTVANTNQFSCAIVSNLYGFAENHTRQDVEPFVISEIQLNNVHSLNKDYRLIFDCEDLVFVDLKEKKQSIVNSIIFFLNDEPAFQIYDYNNLPLLLTGGNVLINFSNGYEKVISFSKGGNPELTKVGNVLIEQRPISEFNRPDEVFSRSNINLTVNELSDKSKLVGKLSTYKDLSISGKAHPLTGDIVTVTNTSAINQSLQNILLANTYDRPFSSQNIAGNLNAFLFDFNDNITKSELESGISLAVTRYEPRITLLDINIKSNPESYSLEIEIKYIIKSTNNQGTFTYFLERA